MPGYRGFVTLVSREGDQRVVEVPGRSKQHCYSCGKQHLQVDNYLPRDNVPTDEYGGWCQPRATVEKLDKQFRRLLSQGWRVIAVSETPPAQPEKPEEEKQEPPKSGALPSEKPGGPSSKEGQPSQSSKKSGKQESKKGQQPSDKKSGKQAGEKKDQGDAGKSVAEKEGGEAPKADSRQKKRGCRGGRGKKAQKGRPHWHREVVTRRGRAKVARHQKLMRAKQGGPSQCGGGGVHSPTPLLLTPEIRKSAEKSAEFLMELVGRAAAKTPSGTTVDAERLLVALEIDDNPLPWLEAPQMRPSLKVLVTPDCSGSTQGWSSLGQAWAEAVSKIPGVDALYVENVNGEFRLPDGAPLKQWKELVRQVDVAIYLGDGDGHDLCHQYAQAGATVVAFDNYLARTEKARLKEVSEKQSGGCVYWIDRVSAKAPDTWYDALRLVLKR